jgi:hypothetical protein
VADRLRDATLFASRDGPSVLGGIRSRASSCCRRPAGDEWTVFPAAKKMRDRKKTGGHPISGGCRGAAATEPYRETEDRWRRRSQQVVRRDRRSEARCRLQVSASGETDVRAGRSRLPPGGRGKRVAGGILLRRRLNRRPQQVTRGVVGSLAGRASQCASRSLFVERRYLDSAFPRLTTRRPVDGGSDFRTYSRSPTPRVCLDRLGVHDSRSRPFHLPLCT